MPVISKLALPKLSFLLKKQFIELLGELNEMKEYIYIKYLTHGRYSVKLSSIFKYFASLRNLCAIQCVFISDLEDMIGVTSLKLFSVPDVDVLISVVCIVFIILVWF